LLADHSYFVTMPNLERKPCPKPGLQALSEATRVTASVAETKIAVLDVTLSRVHQPKWSRRTVRSSPDCSYTHADTCIVRHVKEPISQGA
jgi:hypothetical protein